MVGRGAALAGKSDVDTHTNPEGGNVLPGTFTVLLLHGLMAPANELDTFKETILKEFGRCVAIIEPVCREGTSSLTN